MAGKKLLKTATGEEFQKAVEEKFQIDVEEDDHFKSMSFEYAIACIKMNPEQYLKDIDEIKNSVEGVEEVEAREILTKWLDNLSDYLCLFYSSIVVQRLLMKALFHATGAE